MSRKLFAVLVGLIIIIAAMVLWRTQAPSTPAANQTNNQGPIAELPLFPTGQNTNSNPASSRPDTTQSQPAPVRNVDFNLVSERPVGGASLVGRGATSTLLFIDRATGHLYAVDLANLTTRELSNTTIPQVSEFFAGQTGNDIKVLARYLKDGRIQNFSGRLNLATSTPAQQFLSGDEGVTDLSGNFLSPTIRQIAVAPSQDRLFTLGAGDGQTIIGTVSAWDGSQGVNWFSSPLSEWLISWPASTTIALQSRSASAVGGYLFFLDAKTKKTTEIFGPVPGLSTVVSPNGQKVLYSGNSGEGVVFGVYTLDDKIFHRLPVTTLAEKCTWSQDNLIIYCGVPTRLPVATLPDDWYRGAIQFTDKLWRLDTGNGEASIIYDPALAGQGKTLDATNLILDPLEKQLFLINRTDQRLWSLNLQPGF